MGPHPHHHHRRLAQSHSPARTCQFAPNPSAATQHRGLGPLRSAFADCSRPSTGKWPTNQLVSVRQAFVATFAVRAGTQERHRPYDARVRSEPFSWFLVVGAIFMFLIGLLNLVINWGHFTMLSGGALLVLMPLAFVQGLKQLRAIKRLKQQPSTDTT